MQDYIYTTLPNASRVYPKRSEMLYLVTLCLTFVHRSIIPVYAVNLFRYKNKCKTKRLSTGANFAHVYIEIWDKGILKFNNFSM